MYAPQEEPPPVEGLQEDIVGLATCPERHKLILSEGSPSSDPDRVHIGMLVPVENVQLFHFANHFCRLCMQVDLVCGEKERVTSSGNPGRKKRYHPKRANLSEAGG
eukprot:888234-Rhodomonas_salina.3